MPPLFLVLRFQLSDVFRVSAAGGLVVNGISLSPRKGALIWSGRVYFNGGTVAPTIVEFFSRLGTPPAPVATYTSTGVFNVAWNVGNPYLLKTMMQGTMAGSVTQDLTLVLNIVNDATFQLKMSVNQTWTNPPVGNMMYVAIFGNDDYPD